MIKVALSIIFGLCILPVLAKAQTQEQPPRFAIPRLFDYWGRIPFSDEKVRLDNLAIELQKNKPTFVAYLIFYAGRVSCAVEIQARAIRARNYLVNKHDVRADRVIWVDGGYRDDFTVEVWAWPRDVDAPTPSPTLMEKDAQIIKCKPKSRIRRRRGKT